MIDERNVIAFLHFRNLLLVYSPCWHVFCAGAIHVKIRVTVAGRGGWWFPSPSNICCIYVRTDRFLVPVSACIFYHVAAVPCRQRTSLLVELHLGNSGGATTDAGEGGIILAFCVNDNRQNEY